MNVPALRQWQKEAITSIKQVWATNPKNHVLIAACPGSGKTIMACVASIEKLKDKVVSLILIVSPTVNIKQQWKDDLTKIGINAFDGASNEAMRFRRDRNERIVGEYQAICITYSQLAKDRDLFVELARRERILLIADEVHHADDSEAFGLSLESVAELSSLKLALSGTPFNSSGGALAMCPFEIVMNDEGNPIRKAIPHYTYSYGQAIHHSSCRAIEFIKMYGIGKSTYRSIATQENFQKIIDLSKENKTDSIGALLDPNGSFLHEMLKEGLNALHKIKIKDRMAGMLVVAKSKEHGEQICQLIKDFCKANPDFRDYTILSVYNDTDKAHERIADLRNDRTDIIVTVRMISEGVDVKRLRVGVYATDYRTRMFFNQFVGRFVRWDSRLDSAQHGRIVIPAHIDLLIFAREIELLCEHALIAKEDGTPPTQSERKNELIGTETEITGDGLIFRGNESNERSLANALFNRCKSIVGVLSETQAINLAKELGIEGASYDNERPSETNTQEWWRTKNSKLVAQVARLIRLNGDDDDRVYAKVNSKANRHAGIPKVDSLTSIESLIKRSDFLKAWGSALLSGKEFNNEQVD